MSTDSSSETPEPHSLPKPAGIAGRLRLRGRRLGVPAPASHPVASDVAPDGRIASGKLAGLTMGSAIVVLSWPILIESFLNTLVGLTDTVLAAGLAEGRAATDAVGAASYIIWFIGLVVMAISIGATALVSRAVGAGRLAVANAAVGQTLLLAIASGILVGAMIALVAKPIAVLYQMDERAAHDFVSYLRIVSIGVPMLSVTFCGIACIRGAGDNIGPMLAMIVINVVNIAASWALSGVDITRAVLVDGEIQRRIILQNPFSFDMELAGIAAGTVIAQTVGALLVVGMLLRGSGGVRLIRRRLRPHMHTMARLLRIGFPNFLETLGMWAGNFAVILIVGALGSPGLLGAHIVTIRIEAISFLPGFSMGVAAATLAGQYLGAGRPDLARKTVLICTIIASIFMGIMGALFVIIPKQITGLFTPLPEHLEIVPTLLIITGLAQVPFAISIVLRQGMRGAGDTRAVMWITWITTYGIRLPLVYILSGVEIPLPAWAGGGVIPSPLGLEPSLARLWIGLCIEVGLRALFFWTRYAGDKWTQQRV